MSRKLEALEHIYYGSQGYGETDKYYKYLKNYLQSIDNAEPSEALKCLKIARTVLTNIFGKELLDEEGLNFDSIEQALIKSQEQEKVLGIIKEKNVDISLLKRSENWLDYYTRVKHKTGNNTEITEEEFDLLKRYFK